MLKFQLRTVAAALMLFLSVSIAPRQAGALDKDIKAVLLIGAYGMAAGTVLGLASYPFTKNPRSVFIGTSVGLYMGIGVGFYYLWDKHNPDSPFRNPGAMGHDSRGLSDEDWSSRTIGPERVPPLAYAAFKVADF